MQLLQELNPQGTEQRTRHRFVRRTYHPMGPKYLWHVDGYDKLKPFGFGISGCIDGFSRSSGLLVGLLTMTLLLLQTISILVFNALVLYLWDYKLTVDRKMVDWQQYSALSIITIQTAMLAQEVTCMVHQQAINTSNLGGPGLEKQGSSFSYSLALKICQ